MKCKTLINIIGKYNHYSILAAVNLMPETMVFLRLKEDQECYEKVRACITQKFPDTRVIEHTLREPSVIEIADVLKLYNSEDTYLNVSGGSKLMSLLTFQAAQGGSFTIIYVDIDQGMLLQLKDKAEVLNPIELKLTVEDIVCSSGAEIIKHSSEIYEKNQFKELVDYMIENYDLWKIVKDILRNPRIMRQFELQPLLVELTAEGLSYMQLKALEEFLKLLQQRQLVVSYGFYFEHVEFTFSSRAAKSFVMTAGSWLEALTYSCVKELKEVNSAISGMLFVWDHELQVHNELDVVASVDSHLICISCKDTEKYDIEELNELEVYSEHLGGRKVTKILVSTYKPERGEMIYQRAEEMGINIILFSGDISSFRDKLHRLFIV